MVRRTTHTLALVAALLLVLPAAALAYSLDTVNGSGERTTITVTTATEHIDIRVGFSTTEPRPTGLRVNIGGQGERIAAPCNQGDCSPTFGGGSAVFRLPFTARGGAFGSPTNRIPNGDVRLDVVAQRAGAGDTRLGEVTVRMDVPGSPVSSLSQSVADQEVRLSWSAAPEAGISGYRVERITGDRTTEVTTTTGTSATDAPGPGEHRYRVVTLRPKASSGTHETASSPVTARVEAPPEPEPDEDEDERENGGSTGGSTGGSGGGSNGGSSGGSASGGSNGSGSGGGQASAPRLDREDADGDGGEATGSDDADAPEVSRRAPRERRNASAPRVGTDRGGFGIPELPRVGDIFRGELDFDGDDGEGPDGSRAGGGEDADEVVLSAPGGAGGSFLGSSEEAERIAIPIAGGLLLTAIGLHLWRWLKVPLP